MKHEGEHAKSYESEYRKSSKGMRMTSLDIRPTVNGGFVVDCRYGKNDEPFSSQTKTFAFSSRRELDDYLDDALGTPDETEEE